MNPIKNALKNLSVTTTNVIIALIFFVITAKISSPAFFGKVVIVQLLEIVTSTFFYFIPGQIITREISYLYAKKEITKEVVGKFLSFPFLVLPIFLILLIFPDYVKLAIPYLFLYLLNGVMTAVMIGMDMFTESAITGNFFLVIRWGIAIIAVLYHNIYLFVKIWTLGGILSVSMNYAFISKKVGLVLPTPDFAFLFRHFREGLPVYLSSFAGFLSSQGDRVTTAYLLGSYYLGIYQFSALVAGVPSMILGALGGVLLPTASFYKALGKDEKKMSSLSFIFLSLLTFLTVIISIPIGEIIIIHFFPNYKEGLEVFVLLLISATLPFPIGSLTNFIVAFKRNLRPFLILSILNGSLVLLTSYLLIPRIGIMGGAISQVIVATISSLFIIFYSIRTSVFSTGRKEIILLFLIPVVGIYEAIDPPFLDFLLILLILLVFKLFKIITEEDVKIIEGFLPHGLKFVSKILSKLT
ncbi:lipopolysaccharide biosynthesis protein [Saccharolobus solfataricus]|uniref:Lipopolysaccharide biosynthesis protein n=2 Tax=Saccharolobus solfataricus TaxID=2287 RepID=A0A0E3MDK7_SACSO|nr:lipopolysaccharide biosynthesis protein [Saccharolobus solfataricus]AKA74659.1 lipopolysaccharide biosynthesis protein [Saccharolobus solfataricus]AKA77353.1 lipopolysaccharide biosynthesis protein [Saccharolobus solfataricus]AKA80044.1 lipopolysaccharide biosynthesis protein [Saccharolobus solfataricus]AZF69123.1 lipopolysaccharide biosynthesis protein [Saccharolobus solfataricus]AZF71743.1 lipopolysaccharide biosynthesis protein [Saccharolobus solfataricus]